MTKPKVLVTGASGYIASLILPALRERYELTLVDVRSTNRDGEEVPGIHIQNLIEKDREAYRHLFKGMDAVIHLGFTRPEDGNDPDQRFGAEFDNVQMAYNIYRVSWEEGVRRVVVASSNHAADYYEPLILANKMDVVDPNGRPLSDNYYGWSKEAYEHLGFVFAVGKVQGGGGQDVQADVRAKVKGGNMVGDRSSSISPLENVQIRIGGPRETDVKSCALGDLTCMRRALGAYISARDLSQLIIKSIETEDIRDENGVPFQIFYGVSGNSHAFWSIASARKIIGYAPEDNSEIRFHEHVSAHIQAAQAQSAR
jgi:hypothetical protein